MKQFEIVDKIWKWMNKLKGFTEKKDWNLIKHDLLRVCYPNHNASLDFINEKYSFPSSVTRKIAEDELQIYFDDEKFVLQDLLSHIHENMEKLNENNINNIIFMLVDIVLYKAYKVIENASYGNLYSQLNMCIILDAMKIKPENSTSIASMLKEVSDKASMNLEVLDTSIIWVIAMLNYKIHVYDTAILFFERYLKLVESVNNDEINEKKVHAKIYIGYCYEKNKNFTESISIFEKLLGEMEIKKDQYDIIIELNHGLGHFYNERAVFGRNQPRDEDILKARMYMKKALEEKADYYSCYGSLFHEYGDYENAEFIFQESAENAVIRSSEELAKEMQFYKGQTCSAKAEGHDEQIRQAEENFNEFEEYCKRTFNYDGIVHARIFRIRTWLRSVGFTDILSKRRGNREQINKWYNDLIKYKLSDYASKAIKEEYQKTIDILNVFRVLYADDNFRWHGEDVLYYLKSFIGLMPEETGMLDYVENDVDSADEQNSNLYRMCIDNLWVWCIGGRTLPNIIQQEGVREKLKINGIEEIKVTSVRNKEEAHKCIIGNGKPDLVVLLPPLECEVSFEREVKIIMDAVSESYFLFSKEYSAIYDENWLKEVTRGKRQHQYSDTISNVMSFAYCLRALEILRKELLQPIPLFSLAPTHFSSSYDFQLGENLDIQLNVLAEAKADEEQRRLRKLIQFVDKKYSSKVVGRQLVKNAIEALQELNCKENGFFSACFPQPGIGEEQDDNYISYLISNSSFFDSRMFMHEIREREIYTIKALPAYRDFFWEIEEIINRCAKECAIKDECVVYYETLLTDDNDISTCCRKLLTTIFGKEPMSLKYPYKCILRKMSGSEKEKDYIYIVLGTTEDAITKPKICYRKEENDMKTTVFVTYAWQPEGTEFEKYQKEVYDFTNYLLDCGYDATFDLAVDSENWTQVMVEGLQRDKIIVLLSPEYKRKADETKNTGVAIEKNAVLARLQSDESSIIFAKLSSQKDRSNKEITPIIFSGAKVIDLSKANTTDGYNMLFIRLNDEKVAELHSVAKNRPITKKISDI